MMRIDMSEYYTNTYKLDMYTVRGHFNDCKKKINFFLWEQYKTVQVRKIARL